MKSRWKRSMSNKPNFKGMKFAATTPNSKSEWKEKAEKAIERSLDDLLFETNEQISTKPLYTEEDLAQAEHLKMISQVYLLILVDLIQRCM